MLEAWCRYLDLVGAEAQQITASRARVGGLYAFDRCLRLNGPARFQKACGGCLHADGVCPRRGPVVWPSQEPKTHFILSQWEFASNTHSSGLEAEPRNARVPQHLVDLAYVDMLQDMLEQATAHLAAARTITAEAQGISSHCTSTSDGLVLALQNMFASWPGRRCIFWPGR